MKNIELREISKHFSNRADTYDAIGTWVKNDAILSFMLSCIPDSPEYSIRIIDLGAGTGAVSNYIYNNYMHKKEITAVDICPDMLSKILNPEIEKCIASVEEMPFDDDTFDVAVSRQCLHYVENLDQAVQEIKRVIKDTGTLILSQIVPLESQTKEYWCKLTKFRQPLRKNYFSESDWISLLENKGFTPVSIKRFSHRGSVLKWAQKYKINDKVKINAYKNLLLNAPKQFLKEYDVQQNMNDVNYNSFWFVAKFMHSVEPRGFR